MLNNPIYNANTSVIRTLDSWFRYQAGALFNPLSHNIRIEILQSDLHTFLETLDERICQKIKVFCPLVIILLILVLFPLDQVWILFGENWFWSPLDSPGTRDEVLTQRADGRNVQLPTLFGQQCWQLLCPCWRCCANWCNNFQQCWDLQCIVGRIHPIRRWRLCLMRVRGPNNVRRAVPKGPTLLRYASAITEQKKCWELLALKFDQVSNFAQQLLTTRTCNRVWQRT